MLWKEELGHLPTKGCRQMGSVPSSTAPIQPRQRDPFSARSSPTAETALLTTAAHSQ